MKILFVTNDLMAGRIGSAIAQHLGPNTRFFWISEGKGSQEWQVAGLHAEQRQYPAHNSTEGVLIDLAITTVVVGTSSPSGIEFDFALQANRMGIPVVVLEDICGGHTRLVEKGHINPALVLTCDDIASSLVWKAYPKTKILVIGHPNAVVVRPDPILTIWIENLRREFGPVVLFGGQATFSDLGLVLDCMRISEGVLIPRFHPKLVDKRVGVTTMGDIWREMSGRINGGNFDYPDASTDQLAAAADITCSGFSSLLTTAALAGRVSVSLWTPEVAQQLWIENKLQQVPQVALGISHSISEATRLEKLNPTMSVEEARERVPTLNPISGARAIESLDR